MRALGLAFSLLQSSWRAFFTLKHPCKRWLDYHTGNQRDTSGQGHFTGRSGGMRGEATKIVYIERFAGHFGTVLLMLRLGSYLSRRYDIFD